MYIWEFGIPVVLKAISEPSLDAIQYVSLHSKGRHFLGQTLDNKIVILEARGNFRLNHRKSFKGHKAHGHGCAITTSPDGQFVASGDASGKVWFWDWKTSSVLR